MDIKRLFNLNGKTALITGGTHGLGMSMAKALGHAGADLIINGHSSQKTIDTAIEEYESEGLNVKGFLFDVTREEEVERHIHIIEKEIGPIDILVNNAGIIKRIPIIEMSVKDWESVVSTDLTAPFIVAKKVAHRMIKRKKGKIINVCSMMSELGRETVAAYAAAKGGLKMLTKSMATEWAKYNIQVNGIGPGYFATSQTAPLRVEGSPFNEFIKSRTPAGRWGKPEELGGPVVFLSSEASNFVHGQILYVDGGILATLGKSTKE